MKFRAGTGPGRIDATKRRKRVGRPWSASRERRASVRPAEKSRQARRTLGIVRDQGSGRTTCA